MTTQQRIDTQLAIINLVRRSLQGIERDGIALEDIGGVSEMLKCLAEEIGGVHREMADIALDALTPADGWPEPDGRHCLECQNPPEVEGFPFSQVVCPQCGADWLSIGHYEECRRELRWDSGLRRYVLNEEHTAGDDQRAEDNTLYYREAGEGLGRYAR